VLTTIIAMLGDRELEIDARLFAIEQLDMDDAQAKDLVRAAFVARDAKTYDLVARGDPTYAGRELPINLQPDEKEALREEKDKLFSERGILVVTLAVSLAAFLQGHVQSSINGASPFEYELGIIENDSCAGGSATGSEQWNLGWTNSMPFLSAALIGCWVSMPINERLGRRGAMMVSAVLIFLSSLISGLLLLSGVPRSARWKVLLSVRIINGIGKYSMLSPHINPQTLALDDGQVMIMKQLLVLRGQ
jgi:hypothetical protein